MRRRRRATIRRDRTIVAVYSADGTKLYSYTYDAFGNKTTKYHATDTGGGVSTNYIGYRGYYYDIDLGLYFTQTRLYDPTTGRFISADEEKYLGANGDINSYNLYAYCSNNPVNFSDPSGHFIVSTAIGVGIVLGALFGFGVTTYSDYRDDGEIFNGSIRPESYIVNTILGGMAGGTLAYTAPSFFASIGAVLSNTFSSMVGGTIVSISGIQVAGMVVAGGVITTGIMLFARASTGPIRFNDGTGIDPETGKVFEDPQKAIDYYKTIKEPQLKARWKQWLKGKKWIKSHLK